MLPAGLDASVAFPQGLQPPRPWREPEMMAARTKPRWELLGQAGWLSTKLYCLTCLFAAWFQLLCSPPSPPILLHRKGFTPRSLKLRCLRLIRMQGRKGELRRPTSPW